MKESELFLRELATLVDIDSLNTITMKMEYDEVRSRYLRRLLVYLSL